MDVIVTQEKVFQGDGSSRVVQGIPFDLDRWHGRTAETLQLVLEMMVMEARRGQLSLFDTNGWSYDEYQPKVKRMITQVGQRLLGEDGVGTHVARRTGAALHIHKGWTVKAVMSLGWMESL